MDQHPSGNVPWHDERVLDVLVEKYENTLAILEEQNAHYQSKFEEFKTGMQELVSENQRLTAQLKQALESQIRTLERQRPEPSFQDIEQLNALRQQLLTAAEEKENVLEMWRVALREIERLEDQLQERRELADSKILQEQTMKVKNYYNGVIVALNVQIEKFKEELRRVRENVHAKCLQMSDLPLLLDLEEEKRHSAKDKEKNRILLREKGLQEELKNLQEKFSSLQTNLASNLRESVKLRENNRAFEEQLVHLRNKRSTLESNQSELMEQLKESVQMTEDALLEKDQARLNLEHSRQEVDRLQSALTHLLEEAGVRTKQEVESSRKTCSAQIQQLTDEIKSLEKRNAELQSEAERATRDRQSAVSELERLHDDIQQGELQQAYYEVQKRLIQSEHRSAELLAELESVKAKARMAESNFQQEEKQWMSEQAQVREKLMSLAQECENCLLCKVQLVEHVEQLEKAARDAQRHAEATTRKAIKDCAVLETEKDVLEEHWRSRLKITEEAHEATCNEFKQLLTSQQGLNIRLKSEFKAMTQLLNSKISDIQEENVLLNQRNLDLMTMLEEHNEKFAQLNKQKNKFYLQIRQLEEKLQQKENEVSRLTKFTALDKNDGQTRNGFVGLSQRSYHSTS